MAFFTDEQLDELVEDLNNLADDCDRDYQVAERAELGDEELAMLLLSYRDEAEALLLALIDDGRVMSAFNRFR